MDENEILHRLDAIEHQIHFLADAYRNIHGMFIKGVEVKFEKTLLDSNLSKLNCQMNELSKVIHSLNEMAKNDSFLGTLAFMSKKLHEIENSISSIKRDGIKKKIHLDVRVDGYEMVKKQPAESALNTSCEEHVRKTEIDAIERIEVKKRGRPRAKKRFRFDEGVKGKTLWKTLD